MAGLAQSRKLLPIVLAAGLCALAAPAAQDAPPAGDIGQERIDAAIASAVNYLTAQIGEDGRCAGEYPLKDSRHLYGGKTALCAYALLAADADPNSPALSRAIQWLGQAKLEGTYPVAMRACAFAAMKDPNARGPLAKDVAWLIAAARDGAYTYGPRGPSDPYDNSNSQMAVLGVWAGAVRGVEVPAAYWQAVEKHWLSQQQVDGGWGYFTRRGALQTRTYGSMTAAGLATMYVCYDNLRREQFIRCTGAADYKPIDDALKWLADNFKWTENPGKGPEWYYYWLYCLQRAGAASGNKYFGGQNWYARGAAELVATQNSDGRWGFDRAADTAFALLFLARGREPIAFNKLQYNGKWNARPRDMANLTRWLGHNFERPVNWQAVSLEAPVQEWQDAPVLYISGAGPIELTDAQVGKLRDFVLAGGIILSEAACNSADFSLDMQKIYQRMFPAYRLSRLADDHPIYKINYLLKGLGGLEGVSNGIRLLAIHCPQELSLALQLGESPAQRPVFELAANLYLFITDKSPLRPRGVSLWPARQEFKPIVSINVARLKYEGNWDPEPMAWKRLAILMGNRHHIKLEDSVVEIGRLDAVKWRVAALSGTTALTLNDGQLAALKKYLSDGGTLVVEAAGGSKDFAASAQKQILPLLEGALRGPVASDHPIFHRPQEIRKILYRRDYAQTLGPAANESRLIGLDAGGRLAVIFSPDDLTGGLMGYPCHALRGYSSETAVALMTNILCYGAGVKVDH